MADLLIHYELPATVGISPTRMFAFRCEKCEADFHLDKKPVYCPFCCTRFVSERSFP